MMGAAAAGPGERSAVQRGRKSSPTRGIERSPRVVPHADVSAIVTIGCLLADVAYWPTATDIVPQQNVGLSGQTGSDTRTPEMMLMTHLDGLSPSIDALRKVHSITSQSAVAFMPDDPVPKRHAMCRSSSLAADSCGAPTGSNICIR